MKMRGALLVMVLTSALLTLASPARAVSTIFTVNSIGDEGDAAPSGVCNTEPFLEGTEPECTLRAAIEEANFSTGPDTINFSIGGGGVKTISPASPLPAITQPLTIDGYSEPGASVNTRAVGSSAVLRIRLDGSDAGVEAGLQINANDSVVRGLAVTGFGGAGLFVEGADNTRIEGNFLGTDPEGAQGLGNGAGVLIFDPTNTPSGNTVGSTTPAARNIISGNNGPGVHISGAEGTDVVGNAIGTTTSGTANLGNARGVEVASFPPTANTTIGGAGAARNTIAFNNGDGVRIFDDDVTGTRVLGNSIFSNGNDGVTIFGDVTGTRVLGNSIFSNGNLGINLDLDGVTPNDGIGDADSGPNNLQNFPVITRAKPTKIKGRLESTQSGTFTIQLFSNRKSSKDEGKKLIKEKTLTDIDGDGVISFGVRLRKNLKEGRFVTATATNSVTGDTSEFSAPKKVR